MKRKNPFLNPVYIVFTILAMVMGLLMVMGNNPPEFYDNFGIIVFVSLFILSLWMLKTKKEAPDWVAFLIFLIAVLGLIVDGYIVFFR